MPAAPLPVNVVVAMTLVLGCKALPVAVEAGDAETNIEVRREVEDVEDMDEEWWCR